MQSDCYGTLINIDDKTGQLKPVKKYFPHSSNDSNYCFLPDLCFMLCRDQIGTNTEDQCYTNDSLLYQNILKEQELFSGFEKKQDQYVFYYVCLYITNPEFQGAL